MTKTHRNGSRQGSRSRAVGTSSIVPIGWVLGFLALVACQGTSSIKDAGGADARMATDTIESERADVVPATPDAQSIDLAALDTQRADLAAPDTQPVDLATPDAQAVDLAAPDTQRADLAALDAPVDIGDNCSTIPVSIPGTLVTQLSTPGTCACQGKTLATLVSEASAKKSTWPLLVESWSPGTASASYVYDRGNGSYSIIFYYGWGDCPSGCQSVEYWYFETGADCVPREVGHYRSEYASTCSFTTGAPMWGKPQNSPSNRSCATPENIAGKYSVLAQGTVKSCTPESTLGDPFERTIQIQVDQSPSDLLHARLTVMDMGDARIDGKVVPGLVIGKSVRGSLSESQSTGDCKVTRLIDIALTLESSLSGRLGLKDWQSVCSTVPVACTGGYTLSLSK